MTEKSTQIDVTLDNVKSLINGKGFFSLKFIKRTNKEERTICGLRFSKKHRNGGTLPYSSEDKGLIVMWSPRDVGKHYPGDRGYRNVGYDDILEIRVAGDVWKREGEKFVRLDH